MSGIVSGLVLRTPISDDFTSEAKFIATVYADHAWEDGTHAHPAVETVAKITGYHERTVQRYIHNVLIPMGMLIKDGVGPRGTNQYRFPLEEGSDGSIRLKLKGSGTVPPRLPARGDTESGDTESGDTIVPPELTNVKIHEEEEKDQQFNFSAGLQEELTDLGVFVSTWVHVEKRIAAGWSEADVLALILWMRKTRKDKPKAAQGFVTRVREGTKAPAEYYDFSLRSRTGKWVPVTTRDDHQETSPTETEDDPEPEPVRDIPIMESEITKAWRSVLGQMKLEMPRGMFDAWLSDTCPVSFDDQTLTVAARDDNTRDWLESRMQSTCERLLVGVLNQTVTVEFVVAESVAIETDVPA